MGVSDKEVWVSHIGGSMKLFFKIFLSISLLCSLSALAGSQQNEELKFDAQEVALLAKDVERYAAKQGALAFIISRVGQEEDELPKGVNFTHSAIAVYSEIQLDSGEKVKGYAIHNLYQTEDDKDKSILVTDYPVDFFWGVKSLKAGVLIPTKNLQLRLIKAIQNGDNAKVHNPNYSLISNPFNRRYQNCNEHVLDIVNSAIYQTTERKRLKQNAELYFTPQRLKIGGLKLVMGNLFMDGVHTNDHGRKINTTTFTSIGRYLRENNLLMDSVIIKPEQQVEPLFKG